MTDRAKGFYVVLDQDIREDDVEPILNAIRQIKHVLSVQTLISTVEDDFANQRARMELRKKIYEVLV